MTKIATLKELRALIEKYKEGLVVKARESGMWENFGDKEVREVNEISRNLCLGSSSLDTPEERAAAISAVQSFSEWAATYTIH